jgi:2,4-dienoyl-CoA reductase-like NADH-dependent reductase (Old Yellow Enzyme family)
MGELVLKNRIIMAAMTRLRCDPKDGIPTPLMAEYYAQRAGSGLIITECSAWSQRGIGFPGAGHIFTQ